MELDWGDGDYSLTAAQLEPVAERLVVELGAGPRMSVLDVACGTGNGALAAARRGAGAVGVDPAPALLDAARRRAVAEGLDVDFRSGDAIALPVPDAAFDLVISIFGVIFAPDPRRAVTELLRAVRPGGVVGLTAWLPAGPIHQAVGILMGALPDAAPPTARWDDPGWIGELLTASGGRDVAIERAELIIRAASPEIWLGEAEEHHPAWRSVRRRLDSQTWDRVHTESLAVLRSGNREPGAFAVASPYVVARCRR